MGKGKRGNAKPKIIQWVMQRAMETLFGFANNLAIVSTQREPDQSKERHFGAHRMNRMMSVSIAFYQIRMMFERQREKRRTCLPPEKNFYSG